MDYERLSAEIRRASNRSVYDTPDLVIPHVAPENLERFVGTFAPGRRLIPSVSYLESLLTSRNSPKLVGVDLKEKSPGEFVILELNSAPNNLIGFMLTEADRIKPYEEQDSGFCEFVSLERVVEIWNNFDFSRDLNSGMLSLLMDNKIFTHFAIGKYMPSLLDPTEIMDNDLVVRKSPIGCRSESVQVRQKGKMMTENTEDFDPEFYEEFIRGVPIIENGEDYDVTYRSVALMGFDFNGIPKIEFITTYSRINGLPINDEGDTNEIFRTSISTGGRRGKINPDKKNKIEGVVENSMLELINRTQDPNLRFSLMINHPFVWSFTFNRDKVNSICKHRGIDPPLVYLPEWYRIGDKTFFPYQKSPKEYVQIINHLKPEILITPRFVQIKSDSYDKYSSFLDNFLWDLSKEKFESCIEVVYV